MKKTDIKDSDTALEYTFQRLKTLENKFKIKVNKRKVKEGWSVSIPCNVDGVLDYVFKLELDLCDLGIGFDTGYGFGQRDWELDWSFSYDKPE